MMTRGMKHLHKMRREHNNKYYTPYDFIEERFGDFDYSGMRVYCPCDDYRVSQFVRYFKEHFAEFGIVHLTATCFIEGGRGLRYDYDGKEEKICELEGDGDFRSAETTTIRDESDIIVTNPPFSLVARYFHRWASAKKYIYICDNMICQYKAPLMDVAEGKASVTRTKGIVFLGHNTTSPIKLIYNIPCRRIEKPYVFKAHYDPARYRRYDNYDAINIDHYTDMPMDYDGLMGIPHTTVALLDRSKYDILALLTRVSVEGEKKFKRIIIRRKQNDD